MMRMKGRAVAVTLREAYFNMCIINHHSRTLSNRGITAGNQEM